jgi:hypothetical protein
MPFDVFRLREHVVQEYRDYVESFVHVLDPRIDAFVRERLAEGELWPDAVLQLNPAYEPGPTLGELAANGPLLAIRLGSSDRAYASITTKRMRWRRRVAAKTTSSQLAPGRGKV